MDQLGYPQYLQEDLSGWLSLQTIQVEVAEQLASNGR
jgi:hypothetical protein